jgi:hypothetical protein
MGSSVGIGLSESEADGDGDAASVAVEPALGSVPAHGLGDGVEHAASMAAMSRTVSGRRGAGIGPIVDRSGRVAPQP